jgi:putative transposase
MNDNSNVFPLRQPGNIDDPLTDILRSGARRLLAHAIELEAETLLETMKDLKLADGRDRVVRHGHGPERAIQIGIVPVEVPRVKIRERGRPARASGFGSPPRFSPFGHNGRGTRSLDSLLLVLYLRGISTGDFQEAMSALLGTDASNLSPAVISRLTAEWKEECTRWQKRDLSARHYVYAWADGVYLQAALPLKLRLATARLAFGRRSRRPSPARVTRDVGATKLSMYSTRSRSRCSRK